MTVPFCLDRYFRALKDAGCPLRVSDLTAALGVTRRACSSALWRLKTGGFVFREAAPGRREGVWSIAPKMTIGPHDARGTNPNSLRNLIPGCGTEKMLVASGRKRRASPIVPPARKRKATALERAMGWGCER